MESFEIMIETESYCHCESSFPIHTQNSFRVGKTHHSEINLFTPSPSLKRHKKHSPRHEGNILEQDTKQFFCYSISDISDFDLDNSVDKNDY